MKKWLLYPGVGSVLTLILHFMTGIGWGFSSFLIFVCWPAGGTLMTADDDLPGGFSNPDGDIPPPWRTAEFWGQLSMGIAISAFVTAIEFGLFTVTGGIFAMCSIAAGILTFILLRRRTHLISYPQ